MRMFEKILNSFSIIGGAVGGSVSAWLNTNHEMLIAAIVSVAVFAIVGGVIGYLVHIFMKWFTNRIRNWCIKLLKKMP